jgi:hypothetical protein
MKPWNQETLGIYHKRQKYKFGFMELNGGLMEIKGGFMKSKAREHDRRTQT